MNCPALLAVALWLVAGATTAAPARATETIATVAAENVYGGVARQIGGPAVAVTSIINSPGQDPHLFEASPSVVRQVADARIVIVNGAGYDPWMARLLKTAPRSERMVIDVGRLLGSTPGGNPHLWYDPATMPKVARALTAALDKIDPVHAVARAERLAATLASLGRVQARVAQMRAKWRGTPVTATEPVFGLMAQALGLSMRNEGFQLAVMNETEPSAHDLAAIEDDLRHRKVKALIYNKQVSSPLTARLIAIAEQANVPVVAVTEMQPPNVSFVNWMLGELDALDRALGS
ncbi:MAG TPA: zinc ABC transporter substrate-binding protein [Pseudolabrys sp.]|nr:zinc ABC transporter substrate-binding protein [Pseudolabrys sp.]